MSKTRKNPDLERKVAEIVTRRFGLAMILPLALALALTALATTNNAPLPELRAYPLGLADGPNAVTVITNVLGADARVVFEPGTRKLLIIASSNQHAVAAMIIRELNVPPKNVSITVNFRGMGNSDRTSASVTGGARITRSKQGGTHTTIRLNPDLVEQHGETTSNTRQQLLVISGKSALLSIGEDVPYIEWIMDYGFQHRIIEQQLQWQRVGSFLVIEPTVIGEGPLIRVKLTPELSGLVDNSPYRTRFDTVSTEVVVSDGVPFTIGGGGQNQDFYSRFLIGMDRSGTRRNLTIEMTATILPASTTGP